VPPVTSHLEALTAAAFGADVHRWPLPVPATAAQAWLRAVAAAGQGRYGAAHADLETVRRTAPPSSALLSLACSTTGSLLRQLGWHTRARRWDGTALRLAGDHPEARGDALVGLAADALGVGRFGVSATLLDAARALSGGPPRCAVRLAWVSAELAMARGDGPGAVGHARAGIDAAAAASPRHRTKSDVVLAAALYTAGDLDAARDVADAALTDATRHGLVPLQWAVASLLASVGSTTQTAAQLADTRDRAAALIAHRGGDLRS
jgi:hypothetical protein